MPSYHRLSRLRMHAILQKPSLSEFPEVCACAARFVLHQQRSPLRTVGPRKFFPRSPSCGSNSREPCMCLHSPKSIEQSDLLPTLATEFINGLGWGIEWTSSKTSFKSRRLLIEARLLRLDKLGELSRLWLRRSPTLISLSSISPALTSPTLTLATGSNSL